MDAYHRERKLFKIIFCPSSLGRPSKTPEHMLNILCSSCAMDFSGVAHVLRLKRVLENRD